MNRSVEEEKGREMIEVEMRDKSRRKEKPEGQIPKQKEQREKKLYKVEAKTRAKDLSC